MPDDEAAAEASKERCTLVPVWCVGQHWFQKPKWISMAEPASDEGTGGGSGGSGGGSGGGEAKSDEGEGPPAPAPEAEAVGAVNKGNVWELLRAVAEQKGLLRNGNRRPGGGLGSGSAQLVKQHRSSGDLGFEGEEFQEATAQYDKAIGLALGQQEGEVGKGTLCGGRGRRGLS